MTSIQSICDALGRELDSEEKELFQYMSPQGMAKMNSDVCKGVNLEHTLAEMRIVFQSMKRRRQQIESTLPETAQGIISRMKRPPSTDEMVLLGDVPPSTLLGKINDQLQAGEEMDDIVEDLAVAHRQKQLLFDAQRLANAQGLAVSISRLAPTTRPLMGNVMASNTASFRSNKIRVGLSPIVLWFDEQVKEESPSTPTFALTSPINSPVYTPRSALKHNRRNSPLHTFPTQDSFNSISCLDTDSEHERASQVSFSPQAIADCGSDTDSCHRTPPKRMHRRHADEASSPPSPSHIATTPTSSPSKLSTGFFKLKAKMCHLLISSKTHN
jgi:hypothetical protein